MTEGDALKQFEQLYREYYPRIFSFIYKLCRDFSLTEELTQETFLQAFKGFHKFRGNCEVFTWLAAIAKHTFYKYLRKHKLGLDAISLDYLAETYCINTLGDPENELKRKMVAEAVRRIINGIPEKYRDVVMLRIYGEMSFNQVAQALNISENSAKVIFFRAKKMLMEEIKNEFGL
ncbi:MAG TPA: sigma-70 family RNA polymerase sigma factor [Clostridiales bacterium]|nr:sigma-70 family RNA polymerase sigma factor [Clostridiales bacterium]